MTGNPVPANTALLPPKTVVVTCSTLWPGALSRHSLLLNPAACLLSQTKSTLQLHETKRGPAVFQKTPFYPGILKYKIIHDSCMYPLWSSLILPTSSNIFDSVSILDQLRNTWQLHSVEFESDQDIACRTTIFSRSETIVGTASFERQKMWLFCSFSTQKTQQNVSSDRKCRPMCATCMLWCGSLTRSNDCFGVTAFRAWENNYLPRFSRDLKF